MTLEGFKRIFFVEWFHRLVGSSIGGLFTIPFLTFWGIGWIKKKMAIRCTFLLGLGGL